MGKRTSAPHSASDASCEVSDPVSVCVVCWNKDYEKEISVNSRGRYFERYKPDSSSYTSVYSKKFKIYIPLKTGIQASVEIRIKAEAQSGVSAADVTAAKSNMQSSLSHWNGKFNLQITHPDTANCPVKSLPIKFKVVWVTSNEHYTMKVHSTYPREGVSGSVINVSKTTIVWTYAHEFGHCFGLPDEYSYSTGTDTVKYYQPDGTLDTAINAPPSKPSSDTSSSIMSTHSNTKIAQRHGWFFAIEAKDLIDISGVKCAITI